MFIPTVVRVVPSFFFSLFSLAIIETPTGSVTDGAAQEQGANGCSGMASLRVEREDGGDGGAETTAAAVSESPRLGNNSSDSSTVLYKRPSNCTRHRGPESYSELENRKKKKQ